MGQDLEPWVYLKGIDFAGVASAPQNLLLVKRINYKTGGPSTNYKADSNAFNHLNLPAPPGNYFFNTPTGWQITRAANLRDIQFSLALR